MKIGFVGAGKVGFTLGKYFQSKGISVVGYFSKNIASAKEASSFTNTSCFERCIFFSFKTSNQGKINLPL